MDVRIVSYSGGELARWIPEVARLRIQVFRDYPYLYDGDLAYEEAYLKRYTECPRAVVVLALDGDAVVGASTALPLADEMEAFRTPFAQAGYPVESIFYLAESVLDLRYRGRGLGVRFFEEREAHARKIGGMEWAIFCAVRRPEDHPAKPAGYEPLDRFWAKRGYAPVPGLSAQLAWQEIGEEGESEKTLDFWMKRL